MRLPRIILVLLPLLGVAYRPGAAQETAVVAGRTIAVGSGQALRGVNVRLEGTSRGAMTNTRGEFRIEQVAAGRYIVVASVIGFASEERPVTVGAGELVRIDLLMMGQALEMSDLVVQGRRAQTVLKTDSPARLVPQAVSVMPSELLDRQQVRELDAVLRNVSGVSRSYSTNYRSDFSIRGFDLDIYGSYRRNAVEYAHFVDPMTPAVERIEVLKGPSSVLYGGLEPGGVINIVTKQPLPISRYEVALDGGSFGYARPRLDFTGPLFGSAALVHCR